MKKSTINIIFIFLYLLTCSKIFSQDLIAVQNGGDPTFYEDLQLAITNAVAGDTLYIPGRSYAINETINKELHFVGVGHHPDSTQATNRTVFNGNPQFILDSGADNGSVTGIYFGNTGGTYPKQNIQIKGIVRGYRISQNFLYNGIGQFDSTGDPQFFLIKNNIIKKITLGFDFGFKNNISNNIITSNNSLISNSSVKNNIFLKGYDGLNSPYYGLRPENCVVENNIFINAGLSVNNLDNNILRNNLNGGINGVSGNGNQGSGNYIIGADLVTIFTAYDGSFNEVSSDFHLPNDSPYKNAGRDGTDIGIYGGAFPWKEGSIPFNPHIQIKQIAPATNIDGNLQIKIQVQAQEN